MKRLDWPKEFPSVMQLGGFDCVIGNPPYERIQIMTGNSPAVVEFLKANYRSASSGNFDIFVCFIERGLQLLEGRRALPDTSARTNSSRPSMDAKCGSC